MADEPNQTADHIVPADLVELHELLELDGQIPVTVEPS